MCTYWLLSVIYFIAAELYASTRRKYWFKGLISVVNSSSSRRWWCCSVSSCCMARIAVVIVGGLLRLLPYDQPNLPLHNRPANTPSLRFLFLTLARRFFRNLPFFPTYFCFLARSPFYMVSTHASLAQRFMANESFTMPAYYCTRQDRRQKRPMSE